MAKAFGTATSPGGRGHYGATASSEPIPGPVSFHWHRKTRDRTRNLTPHFRTLAHTHRFGNSIDKRHSNARTTGACSKPADRAAKPWNACMSMNAARRGPPRRARRSIDDLCIDTIRTLSMDAVEQAKSGHPGTPMALASLVYTIWQRFLRYDPHDPAWPIATASCCPMGTLQCFSIRCCISRASRRWGPGKSAAASSRSLSMTLNASVRSTANARDTLSTVSQRVSRRRPGLWVRAVE